MEPAAILERLTASEELPRDALRAASDRRADMVPLFVERIESYVATASAEQESRALFLIFHLLGEWREEGDPFGGCSAIYCNKLDNGGETTNRGESEIGRAHV